MSFLNQLKTQANALQGQKSQQQELLAAQIETVEGACRGTLHYLQELARQLDVIRPAGPAFTLDGKTPWPAMRLTSFRVDARKKRLQDREVFDYIAIGWDALPQSGSPIGGTVSVNFPPDLDRVESRLAAGQVKHERKDIRHPEKNTLQAVRFDYLTQTRGGVTVTANHGSGELQFRLANVSGFGIVNIRLAASNVQTGMLDELAKLVVSQPSRFL